VIRTTVELPFELLESRLRPPRTNGRGIARTALVEQLTRRRPRRPAHRWAPELGLALGYGVEAALEAN